MNHLELAITLAVSAHRGQTDKAGRPYIMHVLRVMMAMKNDDDRIVAVLHDVVEDCDGYELSDLDSFGPEVVETVDRLTRREGEEYFAYIKRLSGNPRAVRVKLADLRDNMDLNRLPVVSDRDAPRMKRYKKARAMLQSAQGYL